MKKTFTPLQRSGGRSRTGRWFQHVLIAAASLAVVAGTQAQILVGPTGAAANNFGSQPAATSWSTLSLAGAAGDTESSAALDTLVGAQTAAGISIVVSNNAGNPPGTSAFAQYSTAGFYLQTRPTGNNTTLLMATLQNTSGAAQNVITLNYTYRQRITGLPPLGEVIPGHRVYYSLSGAASSWVPVGNYGPPSTNVDVSITIPIDVTATPWADTSLLYLIFADDNAAVNNDAANGIDNFAVNLGLPPCPGIVSGPTSVTITQCVVTAVGFSITATGGVTSIQWERNSGAGFTAIAGANNATYTLTPVGVGDSGSQFRAIVSGGGLCAPLTSGAATLTVIADTTGPIPLYALGNANLTNITVVFNELINTNVPGTSEVIGNYSLVDTNTSTFVVLLAAIPLANGRGYLLETEPLNPSHGYEIILAATSDACADNLMTDVTIPVYTYISQPLSITAPWKFLQNVVDPGASWFSIGFDDSAWATANGPFDMKRDGNYPVAPTHCRSNTFYGLQGPVPTCLSMTNPVTGATNMVVYFRTHFNYSGNTNQTFLEFSGKADDGWVTYLNGVELVRFGVAAAPAVITGTSPTTRTVGDGEGRDTAIFNATPALRNGDNLVSVILLQQSTTSSDLTMGLEFRAFTLAQLCAAGSLSIVQVGANVTVTWSGGAVLQQSTDISSPANWSNVPGSPSSPFTTTASGAAKFYRVVCP